MMSADVFLGILAGAVLLLPLLFLAVMSAVAYSLARSPSYWGITAWPMAGVFGFLSLPLVERLPGPTWYGTAYLGVLTVGMFGPLVGAVLGTLTQKRISGKEE